ncbi:transcription antitermination protein NusB [Candidatus Anaplasma sp. TIGMIC]|nr:transcription antitermination protein NusB [Candidatus Anaplasma sp. TIGMIC]
MARFLAAQGAYAMTFASYTLGDLDGLLEYLGEMRTVMDLQKVDKKLLSKILQCMLERQAEVDALITLHISEKWTIDRINLVSLAIIKAGVCELLCLNTNESIVIDEYAGIASSVLEASEISFVNAVLNKAKAVRTVDASELHTHCNPSSGDAIALSERVSESDAGAVPESVTANTATGSVASDLFSVGC